MPSRSRRCSRRPSKGLTLVELTVASAVMIFVALASSSLLVAGLTTQVVQQNQTDLQRDAMGSLSRLADELSEANPACVRIDTAPAGIVFASPRDAMGRFSYDASGSVRWQGYLCYYVDTVDGVPTIVRKWSPLVTPVTTAPPVPATLSCAAFQALPLPRQSIGTHVSALSFTGSNPLTLTLTVDHSGMGRTDRLTVSTRVFLRN